MTGVSRDSIEARERELGRILEQSLNEVFIFDAETLNFIQVNRGARENIGYSLEELQQLTPVDIKPEFSREAFESLVRPLREGQEESICFDTVHARKDGSQYHVEVHLQLATFHDSPAFIAVILDTTARLQAEGDKRDREARLAAILNTAVEAIITIDERGICESFNTAAETMFGYAADEIIGQNVSMLMPSPYREEHDEYLSTYLRTGEKQIIGIGREVVGRRKDGSELPIHLSVSEVQLKERRIFTGFLQDVSEQKTARERLVQSERLAVLGEAMARLAHEGRNSLQRIQIAVETARMCRGSEQEFASQLDAIERASDGLDALLEELRNYAAPLILEKSECSLVNVWRSAWQSIDAQRKGRDAKLIEVTSDGRARCNADSFRLGQLFRNIFENALSACSDPVEIHIRALLTPAEAGPCWSVTLRDNGPGLTSEQATRVFEPFFTTKSKGTGLGMAIVRRIAEAHGGSIHVGHSDLPGAEFTLTLPV